MKKQIEAAKVLEKAHRQRDKPMTAWDWCVAWGIVAVMMAAIFLPAFL